MWVGGQGERRKGKGGGWDDTGENRKRQCSNSSNHRTERWVGGHVERGNTEAAIAGTTGRMWVGGQVERRKDKDGGWEGK